MDFRFGPDLKKFMDEHNLLGDADMIALAGAAKNINDEATREFALTQIQLSRDLHHMKEVHLLNHMDCGAYGGSKAFPGFDAERAFHMDELKKAAATVKEKYPDLTVHTWLAEQKVLFEKI